MADKRISQLIERTDIANNDVLPIVASGATTTNKVTISTIQEWMQDNLDVGVTSVGITLGTTGTDVNVSGSPITTSGNITINIPTASATNRGLLSSANWTTFNNKLSSVGLTMPSAFTVSNSPLTANGTIAVTGAGTVAQYIRGDGSLADFPQGGGGGGASVSYYLNGSVSQGTIGGIAYREMNKTPILGSGTDFTINANGYIASFITDAGDPNLLLIPGGNWNLETYFAASSGGGSPSFYVELYKVDSGGTATLVASNSANPELIAFGTTTTAYFSSLAVPATVLTLTDRLALRYYVTHSGRTITLHTENSNLCQIITTFTTGLTALNGLTAQVQNFATGTSGTDFNISSASTTHTFNLPDASASNRGAVTTGSQVFGGVKTFANGLSLPSAGGSNQVTRIVNIGTLHEGSATLNQIGFNSANNIYFGKGLSNGGVLQWTNAAVRYYTLPDADGTLALASQLGAYLPLAGGTLTGALNGTSAVFSGDVQSGTRLIAAASSQSILLTPNSGGTTNRVESVGTLPLALVSAAAITLAAGGTTPQITLATGGGVTLTGALNGTSASFSGSVTSQVNNISADGSGVVLQGYVDNNLRIAVRGSGYNSGSRGGLIASTGDFSSSVTATKGFFSSNAASDSTTALLANASTNDSTTYAALFGSLNAGYRMVVRADGNVGIGTASPASRLEVTSSAFNVATFNSTFGQMAISFANSGTTFSQIGSGVSVCHTAAADDLGFGTAGLNKNIVFATGTGYTERMRITSSGNVGIGTASPGGLLHSLKSGTAIAGVGDEVFIGQNSSGASNSAVTIVSNNEAIIRMTNTTNVELGKILYNTTSNFMRFDTNSTERMRITSAGNVGIGTASPSVSLNVVGNAKFETSSGNRYIEIASSTSSIQIGTDGTNQFLYGVGNFPLTFSTNATERMRITSGGDLLVGQNTLTLSANGWALQAGGTGHASFQVTNNEAFVFNNRNTGTTYQIDFRTNSVERGSINVTDSSTSYSTTSDYRLKEDLQEIKGLEKLSALKVYDFKWKESEERMEGVLAHELAEVIPYAVHGEKDGEKFQQVDYSKIVPILIKAIQELKTEIDSLKNQIK